MFDIGLIEIALIALVGLLIAGPNDIPKIMHSAGKLFRRLRYMQFAFTQQIDGFVDKLDKEMSQSERKETPPETFDEEAADAGLIKEMEALPPRLEDTPQYEEFDESTLAEEAPDESTLVVDEVPPQPKPQASLFDIPEEIKSRD